MRSCLISLIIPKRSSFGINCNSMYKKFKRLAPTKNPVPTMYGRTDLSKAVRFVAFRVLVCAAGTSAGNDSGRERLVG